MAVSITIAITQNSQNITNNTSNVTVKVNAKWTNGSYNHLQKSGWLTIDGTKYTFTSSFNTGNTTSGTCNLFTKTVNVTHNSNGTKTLSCSASYTSGVSSGTVGASASKALTTIPRKSTMSVANGTLGTSQTLTITRQSTDFTHSIKAVCGSSTLYIKADGSTSTSEVKHNDCSIPFTPPLSWASQNTTGTSVSVTYTITTYNGSTSVGSNAYAKTCSIPASVKPSCSISVTDPTGHLATYGGYVEGVSKFKVTVTPTLAYGSAIASYSASANGSTYKSSSFTTDIIKSHGQLTISATVTDKRGRTSAKATATPTVLYYVKPEITALDVYRGDAQGNKDEQQGSNIWIKLGGSIEPLANQNGASYKVEYKKTTESSYTAINVDTSKLDDKYSLGTGYLVSFAADTGSSYDIRLSAIDNFNTTTKTVKVSTAFTLMHWLASGLGFAIGKIAELANVFDIGFQTRFSGGILHPVLEAGTDLNDVLTPNTYVGANVSSNNYLNCPLTSGTFSLEVVGMGTSGQVKQRLTECKKTDARAFERIYYQSAWGDWICVSDYAGKLLWSGTYYMTATHTATLSELVSKQKSGIVLVFSEYVDGAAADQSWHERFIPKYVVAAHASKAQCVQMSTSNLAYFATKYLYVHDDKIVGHDNNGKTGTGTCGITYTNNRFVLRYVIGV